MSDIAFHGSTQRAQKSIVGHSHVPARPSRLRVLFWRIFRWARYAAHVRPVQLGSSLVGLDYNSCPTKWRHEHFVIAANGTTTTHDVEAE